MKTANLPSCSPCAAKLWLALVAAFGTSQAGIAADATWSSLYNGSWATGANWSPTAAPGATTGNTNPDTATFNTLGSPFITVAANQNIANITFSTLSGVNNYLFTGGSLLPTAAGTIETLSGYTGAVGFNTPVTLQGNYTFRSNGIVTSGLNFNTVTTAASTSATLTLAGGNTGVFSTVQGVISQGAGGTLSLIKSGSGTWLLVNANTYTGGTTLDGGTLIVGNATALGTSGTITVASNSTIRTNTALTDPSARITISDGATLTYDTNGSGANWTGVMSNSGGTNTAGFTKTGLGALNLTPAAGAVQTYRGATTVNMGTLTISGASQTANFSNLINSNSSLVLGGGNFNFTGRTNVTPTTTTGASGSNTLTVNNAAGVFVGQDVTGTGVPAGSTVTGISGTTITISQNLTAAVSGSTTSFRTISSQTFAGTTLNAGVSGFIPAANTGANTFDFGTITRNAGSLLDIQGVGGYTIRAGNMTSNAGGLVHGVLFSGDFARSTGGTLSATTYTTQNAAGSWTSGTANYVTTAAVTGSVGTATINSLKLNFAGSNSFTITGSLALNDGLLFGSGINANASRISGGSITGGAANSDLIIVNNNAQNTIGRNEINSTIADFSGGSTNVVLYARATNSTLWLTGNNTYTGNTYIGGGANAATGNMITLVGGAAGASIGSAGKTVFLNGGTGGISNILRIGNADATGDVLGTIQVDNGNLSLNRTDINTLSAQVRGVAGGGFITLANTGNTTVTLASGNNTFQLLQSTAAGTLNLQGAGSVNTFISTAPFNGTFVSGSTVNFQSGTYIFNATGNSGVNRTGTWNVQGATVQILGARYFNSGGGTISVSSGTVQFGGDRITAGEQQGAGTAITFNVSGTGVLDVAAGSAGGFHLGTGGSFTQNSTSSATVNQTGGVVQVGVNAPLANAGSPTNINLTLGNGTSTVQTAYNLSGGALRVAGTIQGVALAPTTLTGVTTSTASNQITVLANLINFQVGQTLTGTNAGNNIFAPGTTVTAYSSTTATLSQNPILSGSAQTVTSTQLSPLYRVFNWTGGRLTAGAVNMTNLGGGGNGVVYTAGDTGTLFQTGATSVMAPGETVDGITFTGRTTITGNYEIRDGGTLDLRLGGLTAAVRFRDVAAAYDNVRVSGNVTLTSAQLALSFVNGFQPILNQGFTLLDLSTPGTSITGTFTNAPGGLYTILVGNDEYTFTLNYAAATDGNDLRATLTSITPIPEPSSVAMLAGLAALASGAVVRRRRRGATTEA